MAVPATALVLVAVQAAAQPAPPAATTPPPATTPPAPPETLETPYEDTPPAPPQTTSPAPAPEPEPEPERTQPAVAAAPGRIDLNPPGLPDTRPRLPIRAERRLVLTAETAWNGLASFGPVLTYHAHPHFSVDLGAGLSLLGGKVGLRARYNLLKSPLTPFVGAGFNATSGFGRFTTDPKNDPNGDPDREPATVDVAPSYLLQGVVGIDYTHRRGFTFVACSGWSQLLDGGYNVVDGTLSEEEKQGFDIAFKGGLVVSLAFGYAFK